MSAGCGVEAITPPAEPIALPMVVSDFFSPDGFWGDGEKRGSLDLQRDCPSRAAGAVGDCYRVSYLPGAKRYAGINWQYPHNNWGFWPGRKIAPGATKITFKARGAKGGEAVGFGAGQADDMNGYGDSFSISPQTLQLTNSWQSFKVDFLGEDYGRSPSGVIGAFIASPAPGEGEELVEFFLDDLKWER
ncbi:MAG: hypothetical protein SF187_14120 [Deltaproteobacteria bacterium]|nr:hypothetical protein [Deltaproteobacteria bacterium]